jgi:hypothetical protein
VAGYGFADRPLYAGSRAVYCHTSMTRQTAERSGAPHLIDTRGDASFTFVYAAVVLCEVVVLAALWFFSRYYSG